MAIGLSNHLKIGDAAQHEHTANEVATIRTFWSLYFLDRLVHVCINLHKWAKLIRQCLLFASYRVATPKLGCPSGIPWDVEYITPYIDTVPADAVDMAALTFDHHCRLFHIQQRYIDIM